MASGVPEGSILGPVIFILAIQALADHKVDGSLGLFTDGTKDLMAIIIEEDAIKLQKDLVKLQVWSTKHNKFLNT